MSGVRFVAAQSPMRDPRLSSRLFHMYDGDTFIGNIKPHTHSRCWATFYGRPSHLCNSVQEAKDWLIVEAMKERMTR